MFGLPYIRSSDKPWRDSNAFNTQLSDTRPRDRGCVYYDSTDHKPHECAKASDPKKEDFLKNAFALPVPEMITGRRNARVGKRVCFAEDDTTPPSVTEETRITR